MSDDPPPPIVLCWLEKPKTRVIMDKCDICGKPVYGPYWAHTNGNYKLMYSDEYYRGHFECLYQHYYGHPPPRPVLLAHCLTGRQRYFRLLAGSIHRDDVEDLGGWKI